MQNKINAKGRECVSWQIIVVILCLCVSVFLSGCDQQEKIVNKSEQENAKAKEYVETLASTHKKAQKNIQEETNKENEKSDEEMSVADEEIQNEKEPEGDINNNLQKDTSMNNIPQQINMEFAQTCKSAILKTNKGDLTIKFYNGDAPVSVANFCTIAHKGDYDNVIFHRVIKDFMIQGGDPDGTGMGGPGYKFDDEIHANNKNNVGTIAMANSGPGTNGSQFFINIKANNFLDTKHTVFGEVTEGMEVVTKIENTEVGANDKPVEDIMIESIELKIN